jgi:hypothetical protein
MERRWNLKLVLTIPSHVRGPLNFIATSYKIWNVTSNFHLLYIPHGAIRTIAPY